MLFSFVLGLHPVCSLVFGLVLPIVCLPVQLFIQHAWESQNSKWFNMCSPLLQARATSRKWLSMVASRIWTLISNLFILLDVSSKLWKDYCGCACDFRCDLIYYYDHQKLYIYSYSTCHRQYKAPSKWLGLFFVSKDLVCPPTCLCLKF